MRDAGYGEKERIKRARYLEPTRKAPVTSKRPEGADISENTM